MRRLTRLLTTPTGLLVFWVGYGLLHVGLNLSFNTGLDRDDAEAREMLQNTLSWGYQVRNPPLFEWLLYGSTKLFGPGPVASIALRYGLILAIGLSAYGAVRRITRDDNAAAAASLGLFGFVWFTAAFHTWATHTMILVIAVFWLAEAVDAYFKNPSNRAAIALAGVVAIGLLAKWSFVIPLAGLAAAILLDKGLRPALWNPRLLWVPLIGAAALAPTLMWIAGQGESVVAMSADNLVPSSAPWAERALEALWRFPASYLAFLLPWALLAAGLGYRARTSGFKPAGATEAVLWRAAVITGALSWLGLLATGATNVAERYMYPVALLVPIAAALTISRRTDARRVALGFAVFALVAVTIMVPVRLLALTTGGYPERKQNKHLIPYPALAVKLEELGLSKAFFIAETTTLSGNLWTYLPSAHAAAAGGSRRLKTHAFQSGDPCLAIWHGGFRTDPLSVPDVQVPAALAALLPAAPDATRIDVPWPPTLLGKRRTSTWFVVDLGTGAEACRTVFGMGGSD